MNCTIKSVIRTTGLAVIMYLPQFAHSNDVFNGKEVFIRECMACHGAAGEGIMPGMPNFKEGKTLFKSDNELMDIIGGGRGIMPSFNGLISDEDIRDVTAYLRTFL